MKHNIKTKIIISFVLLIVLLLIGQIVFNIFFSKSYFVEQNKTEVEELFLKIKNSYSDDPQDIYELVHESDYINGFAVQVLSKEGLIYTSRNFYDIGGNPPNKRLPFVITITPSEYSETPIATVSNKNIDEVIEIKGKFLHNGEYRFIHINKPIESIEASVDVFTRSSIIISTVILAVGLIVIFLIAKSISSPIKDIEIVSQNLANLDFSYRADEKNSTKELSSLAVSINSMSTQLSRNILDLKNANIKLLEDIEYQKKQEQSRKDFIANISHEMKTPLALMQLYCENLKSNIDEIDKDEYCDIIIEETQRLDGIVRDMLNISAVENGLLKMQKEKINLSQSANDIIINLSPLLEDFSLTININPNVFVFGDKKQIEEAMRNYIMNAISHCPQNKEIKISLDTEKENVVFSVYNDGEQILPKDIENIWDSFYKIDKSRTRKLTENAGLGLYIVKVIIENHHGKYCVANENNGVTFNFSLTISS